MTRQLFAFLIIAAPLSATASLAVTIQHTDATCNYSDGIATAIASGGQPPYSYLWSTGETTSQVFLAAGVYSVIVTDALGEEMAANVTIASTPYVLAGGGGYAFCTGPTNVLDAPMPEGQPVGPWYVDGMPVWTMDDGSGRYAFPVSGIVGEVHTISDGNGCTGTITESPVWPAGVWPEVTVTQVEPSCLASGDGRILVTSSAQAAFGTWLHLARPDGQETYQAYTPDATGLVVFDGLQPGLYGVHWWLGYTAEAADPGECSYDTLWVTVPDISPFCGSVSGTSWFDADGDCVRGPNEVGVPYSTLLIQPGGEIAITDGTGHFLFGMPDGSYTLEQTDPTLTPICPVVQPIPFTVSGDDQTIDLANGSTVPLDLSVDLASGVFRPGFQTSYAVYVRNVSPQLSGPLELTVQLDPTLSFLGASVVPTSVAGQTLTWNLPALQSFGMQSIVIDVQVPVGTPLGLGLNTVATLTNPVVESTQLNNTATEQNTVVGSYDPNDKRAVTSSRASDALYFIDGDEWIDYTIRFQNTGTFPAEFVVITDTIDPELDLLSFVQGAASHPFSVSFKPGRVIEWRFDDIQLPDSASDEPGSHGLVKFRMKPRLPLVAGTLIENIANIYFDFNEPVITDPSVLMAEFSTDVQRTSATDPLVFPNPATNILHLAGPVPSQQEMVWRIQSLDGRDVLLGPGTALGGGIDVSTLAPGTYLLVLDHADRRLTARFSCTGPGR
ncbi:MAG: DUF7619 domain-containing protein [Flavobacteriales bacterium]